MSYTPTNWKTGDIVTSEKLNKLENGVADAGGSGWLVVGVTDDGTASICNKTAGEILSASPFVLFYESIEGNGAVEFLSVFTSGIGYTFVTTGGKSYVALRADDYPTTEVPK